ncbi:MAG: hypothetical protein NUV77_24085, partial [Thermoguttaceae bacterium]|nr:hypothetical protein [Thermoguttaceae bacterium]
MPISDWTRALGERLNLHPRKRCGRPKNRQHRTLVFEPLDRRELLTATVMYGALVPEDQYAPSAIACGDGFAAASGSISIGVDAAFGGAADGRITATGFTAAARGATSHIQQWGAEAGRDIAHVLSTGFVVEPGAVFTPLKIDDYSFTTPSASATTQSWVDRQGVAYTALVDYDSTLTVTATTGSDDGWTYSETLTSVWVVTMTGGDGSTSHERDTYSYTFVASGDPLAPTFTFMVKASGRAFGSEKPLVYGPVEESAARSVSLLAAGECALLDSMEDMWPWNWNWEEEYEQIIANGGSSGSGSSHSEYSDSGSYSYTVDGGEVAGTYQESGVYDYSYAYETTATSGSGGWTITGSGWGDESGEIHYSYGGGGSYAQSGSASGSGSGSGSTYGWDSWTLSGTISEGGGDDTSYDYTTYYALDSSGSWGVTSGSGGSTGSGSTHWSYAGEGQYTVDYEDYSIHGTFDESGGENTSYDFQTSATAGSDGEWTESGTGTEIEDGYNDFSFAGSGSFADSGSGALGQSGWETWSLSATVDESGGDGSSYDYTTHYDLDSSDGWTGTSG